MCTTTEQQYDLNEIYPKFLSSQRLEMERHKWIESEKANRDLGIDAYFDWISKYAQQYREEYFIKYNIDINKNTRNKK